MSIAARAAAPLQERSEPLIGPPDYFPDLDTQIAAIRARQQATRPWRVASVDEALSVPAIFSAVTLIAGTMGTLTMEGYRNEALVASSDRPRLIVRPNPFTKPYTFWFLSAFYKATRGERWWWVAARDERDGTPLSLYPVPPWEVMVEENQRNRLRPIIKWNDEVVPNEDMISDFWFPDHTGLRGVGPLQKAGVAVSVAVEAEHWAANFFSGSMPSIIGTTEQEMTEDELEALDRQWAEKPNNMPRWLTQGLTLSAPPYNAETSQLTDTRQFNVGDVARMFSMPGSLIEYQMSGSSLRYQNDETVWTDFQRRCLGPIFAEPMEQDMSDLLARSWTAQFSFDRMLRADQKTRYESYQLGIDAGFLTLEEARRKEGMEPGSVEYAPVPQSQPQAVPERLPFQSRSAASGDCTNCGKHLADVAPPGWRTTCPRCKTTNENLQERTIQEHPQPIINVHPASVEGPTITFERGAFEAPDMSGLGEAIAGLANRPTPSVQVQVDAPDMSGVAEAMSSLADRPQPDITVHSPEVHVEPANVTFEAGAITTPEIHVEPPNVTVNVPKQPAAQVNLPEPKPMRREIKRDSDNNIIEIVEVPA